MVRPYRFHNTDTALDALECLVVELTILDMSRDNPIQHTLTALCQWWRARSSCGTYSQLLQRPLPFVVLDDLSQTSASGVLSPDRYSIGKKASHHLSW